MDTLHTTLIMYLGRETVESKLNESILLELQCVKIEVVIIKRFLFEKIPPRNTKDTQRIPTTN